MNFFKFHGKDVGIDLGTSSILVVLKEKGIIKNEPAMIAIEKKTNDIVAVGNEAKQMIGKTPEKIEALRPLKHGGIANLNATEMIVKQIIEELQREENIGSPREILRRAFESHLIEDGEEWINMMLARNSLSHLYDEETSRKIYKEIKEKYIKLLEKLNNKFETLI